jgi:hypothetical protein
MLNRRILWPLPPLSDCDSRRGNRVASQFCILTTATFYEGQLLEKAPRIALILGSFASKIDTKGPKMKQKDGFCLPYGNWLPSVII